MSRRRTKRPLPLFEAIDPAGSLTDGMLSLWEQQTRLLLEMGAEAALRARLVRLLPGANDNGAEDRQPMSGRVESGHGTAQETPDRLALAGTIATLRDVDRRYRLRDAEAHNMAHARRVLLALLRTGATDEQPQSGQNQRNAA